MGLGEWEPLSVICCQGNGSRSMSGMQKHNSSSLFSGLCHGSVCVTKRSPRVMVHGAGSPFGLIQAAAEVLAVGKDGLG